MKAFLNARVSKVLVWLGLMCNVVVAAICLAYASWMGTASSAVMALGLCSVLHVIYAEEKRRREEHFTLTIQGGAELFALRWVENKDEEGEPLPPVLVLDMKQSCSGYFTQSEEYELRFHIVKYGSVPEPSRVKCAMCHGGESE